MGLFYVFCLKVLFVTRFEKIVRNDFSRPKGARRAAHREVGCNPFRRTIYIKKAPSNFGGAFFMYFAWRFCSSLGSTNSSGMNLNTRSVALRAKGRTPGVINRQERCYSLHPCSSPFGPSHKAWCSKLIQSILVTSDSEPDKFDWIKFEQPKADP